MATIKRCNYCRLLASPMNLGNETPQLFPYCDPISSQTAIRNMREGFACSQTQLAATSRRILPDFNLSSPLMSCSYVLRLFLALSEQ